MCPTKISETRGYPVPLAEDPDKALYEISIKTASIKNQILLPESLRDDVIWSIHQSEGHLGVTKTIRGLTRKVWWPTLRGDIVNTVRQCTVCLEKLKGNPHVGEPVDPAAQEPGQQLYVDLMGPITTTPESGYQYILVATDSYSKFVFLEPLENKTGEAVAQTLLDRIFLLTGVPECVYSDGGLEFTNSIT